MKSRKKKKQKKQKKSSGIGVLLLVLIICGLLWGRGDDDSQKESTQKSNVTISKKEAEEVVTAILAEDKMGYDLAFKTKKGYGYRTGSVSYISLVDNDRMVLTEMKITKSDIAGRKSTKVSDIKTVSIGVAYDLGDEDESNQILLEHGAENLREYIERIPAEQAMKYLVPEE